MPWGSWSEIGRMSPARWFAGGMTSGDAERWETHPVTPDRFEDFADVINPNRRATHCWCLSHRIKPREIEELGHGSREQAMRALCERSTRRAS